MSEPKIDRTKQQWKHALRTSVRVFYDFQRMRLQVEGRTHHKPKEGADSKQGDILLHPGDLERLKARTNELKRLEKAALKDVLNLLKEDSFYVKVLSDKTKYKGVGPTMAGLMLAEFDVHKGSTVSKFWRFAGLASIPAYRCKKCHGLVDSFDEAPGEMRYRHRMASTQRELDEDKKSKAKCKRGDVVWADSVYASGEREHPVKGEKLHYNAFLRMKMLGVLGAILLKCGSPWKNDPIATSEP